MPLEIRELVIKVTVEEKSGKPEADVEHTLQTLKAQVVNECLEKIVRKLENASQR
ncbi:hypothetical protein HNQ91_002748 [Filimonas zeae]|uniref:Uncharacterized protein n=1 Tax=Filimonas zeae TaxID=1737353 RepID=A0A917MWH9_9BACT|nr:DUF5908 family protein [Filimonas zeae]MDR6339683.1 hypothetical protein [Filimonas zeae]GGH69130.1 hypothetical protein GCM10011379_26140 [Filimonas zeae]